MYKRKIGKFIKNINPILSQIGYGSHLITGTGSNAQKHSCIVLIRTVGDIHSKDYVRVATSYMFDINDAVKNESYFTKIIAELYKELKTTGDTEYLNKMKNKYCN